MDYQEYVKLQESEAGEWEGGWAQQMLDALFSCVKDLPKNTKILDIGCNKGRSLFELKDKGYENVYGVDISPNNTIHGRKLGLNCLTMDMEDLSMFSNKYFDFAFMSHAIEHSLDPRKAISEMLRVSKKGLIICPIEESKKIEVNSPHTSPFYTEQEWISVFSLFEKSCSTFSHVEMFRIGKEVWTKYITL